MLPLKFVYGLFEIASCVCEPAFGSQITVFLFPSLNDVPPTCAVTVEVPVVSGSVPSFINATLAAFSSPLLVPTAETFEFAVNVKSIASSAFKNISKTIYLLVVLSVSFFAVKAYIPP